MGKIKYFTEEEKKIAQSKWSNDYKHKDNKYYVYVYLDPRKEGEFVFGEYKFTNKPFYIGKGSGYRLNFHLNNVKSGLFEKTYKNNKIKKILDSGLTPIIKKIKSNLTENEALDLEKEIIKFIGREFLTNITDGGDGVSGFKMYEEILEDKRVKVLQIDFFGDIIKCWDSIILAKESLGIKTPISNVCRLKKLSAGGFIWRYEYDYDKEQILSDIKNQKNKSFNLRSINGKRNCKEVYEFNFNGVLLNHWSSLTDASEFYDISISNIVSSIKEERNIMNSIWSYSPILKMGVLNKILNKSENKENILKNRIDLKYKPLKGKKIRQIKDGVIVKEWLNLTDINKKLGIPISNISKVCSGERKTAGGFKWELIK